jgi:hypothetical protein
VPLHTRPPDQADVDQVKAALANLNLDRVPGFRRSLSSDGHGNPSPNPDRQQIDGIALTAPHLVFNMGLDRVAAGDPLEVARLTGRRFLVFVGTEVVATAEIANVKNGADVYASDAGAAMAKAIREVEATGDFEFRDAEVRLLRIPALYVFALWLHQSTDDSGADLLIPLDPCPSQLVAGRRYTWRDTARILQPEAQRAMDLQ